MAGQNTISITFKLDGDNKGFKALATDADALKSVMSGTFVEAKKLESFNFGKMPTQAAAAMRSFNGLNTQIQYLARELPSLAISPQTFFLAISNNLPMLADEIDNVRAKNEALVAQGKNVVPVWQQVAKSLFSRQTAMVVGVTLLTAYGGEIVTWAKSVLKGKEALDDLITKNKEFQESVRKDYSAALISFEKLRRGWIELGDDMDAKQQFIKDNTSESGNLIENATKAIKANNTVWSGTASTIKDIEGNIRILNGQLQTASMDEAAAINREIKLWQQKSDAIKQAGLDAESTGVKTEDSLMGSWGGIKQLGSSIEGITSALQGNGNAWQSVVGIVDGFIDLYNGIQTILELTELLTTASAAHTAAKGAEAIVETTAASARGAAVAISTTAATATIAANKLAAASFKELAASEFMAAHAAIPFAGFAIGAGFTTAMMSITSAAGIPAFANGGVVSGPTLAMVGEYAGAGNNPEVIAPLDKLRSLLNTDGAGVGGEVDFKISGYELRGILNKINGRSSRG